MIIFWLYTEWSFSVCRKPQHILVVGVLVYIFLAMFQMV